MWNVKDRGELAGERRLSRPGRADDGYAPRTAVEHLLSLYRNARKELRPLQPDQRPIGHFGFFQRADLWDEPVRWLLDAR